MRELGPGLWHWEAPHPEWEGSVRWGQLVSSYAIDDGGLLLLLDPIAPPSEIVDLAAGRLPVGVEAFPGWEHNDVVLWIENRRAIVVGDALVDFGKGLEISPSAKLMTPEQIAERLRPLLALPVEQVLATHGGPTDRAALDRALA